MCCSCDCSTGEINVSRDAMDEDDGGDVPPGQVEPPDQGDLNKPPVADPKKDNTPKPGSAPPKRATEPPKPPTQKAGGEKRNAPKRNEPGEPKQTMQMEPVAWSLDTEQQRATTVTLTDLLAAQPVGCCNANPQFVNTAAPGNNIIGTHALTHEVKGPNLESFVQELFILGLDTGQDMCPG